MPHTAMSHVLRDRCGSTSSAESTGSSQPLSMSLDSQAEDPRRLRQSNSSRYKTELCRAFEEYGTCKYGEKCQFAHGMSELRSLCRHPKYKTELCRTFHTEGFCPYGKRCHFVHTPKEELANLSGEMKLSPLELHPHPDQPIFMDNFPSPPHLTPQQHIPTSNRLEFYDPIKRKNEFLYFQNEFPPLQLQCVEREIGELKRHFVHQQQQQQAQNPTYGRQLTEQVSWQAQALRNALQEVAKNRLPVFSGLGTA